MTDGRNTEERGIQALQEAARRTRLVEDPEQPVGRTLESPADRLLRVDSPLGWLYLGASTSGVRLVRRGGPVEDFIRDYRRRFGRFLVESSDAGAGRLAEQVARTLAGDGVGVPLDLSGTTPFQRRVLDVVSGIPRGEVRPYVWVAREAGSPNASRAVGNVMANNPVPLLVPCHRVVKNDGRTGNYAFGAGEKVSLLEHEGVATGEVAGTPYVATPATGIVCHATCRNAKRVSLESRRPFRSAAGAARAGYRPCRTCRPVLPRLGS